MQQSVMVGGNPRSTGRHPIRPRCGRRYSAREYPFPGTRSEVTRDHRDEIYCENQRLVGEAQEERVQTYYRSKTFCIFCLIKATNFFASSLIRPMAACFDSVANCWARCGLLSMDGSLRSMIISDMSFRQSSETKKSIRRIDFLHKKLKMWSK